MWGLIGLAAGVLLFIYSGWFILIPIAAVAGATLPLFLSKGDAPQKIARLEALETWTRSLSGLTVAGAGLEQTLTSSLASAPEAIKTQVGSLVARLNARWPTREALEAFARDFDDPTADLIVMHLLLKEQARGAGLAEALDDLAEIIFEEVKVRRQIETDGFEDVMAGCANRLTLPAWCGSSPRAKSIRSASGGESARSSTSRKRSCHPGVVSQAGCGGVRPARTVSTAPTPPGQPRWSRPTSCWSPT